MTGGKTLREIKELLINSIDQDFINFNPNHGWNLSTKKGLKSFNSEETVYQTQNLYQCIDALWTNLRFDENLLNAVFIFERCIITGEAYGEQDNTNLGVFWNELMLDNWKIVYAGPLSSGNNKSPSVIKTSLGALECIKSITEIASFNDYEYLEYISKMLIERLNEYQD